MVNDPDALERASSAPEHQPLPATPEASEHRPFRSWALQQDLISLIGSASDWRESSTDLGIESAPERTAEEIRGQRYLRESLEPDQRIALRSKTAAALWAAVLITDSLNQWGPTGIRMSSDSFTIMFVSVSATLLFVLTIFPRLKPRAHAVVEQLFLGLAYALVAFQCADTGGAESPYLVWLVFTVFFVSYFLPRRRAIANVAVAIAVGLSTVFMEQTDGGWYTFVILLTLTVVSTLLSGSILHQRRLELDVERANRFLALADPLTGVANLRSFEQFANEVDERGGDSFALAMVDMNGLKGANTVFGHDVGDGMLVRMTKLLLNASNPRSQVFRIGGDEFVVLMPGGESDLAQWEARFEQLVTDHNLRVRGRLPQISMSIGSSISPDDGTDVDELLDIADRRMYEQKVPAVQPPHELDGPNPTDGGSLLRTARFSDVPSRSIEPRDILRHAALNWLVVSALTLLALTLDDDLITRWAVYAVGAFGLVMCALVLASLRYGSRKSILAVIDVSTILFGGLSMLATGGSESPIQLAMMLPVAFYAQYLHGREAIIRVVMICVVYTSVFWGYGGVSDAGESLYATIMTGIVVLTAVLQSSSGSIARSLEVIRQSATLDPLTRIPNVHAFHEDLAEAIRRAAVDPTHRLRPALTIADLDDFRSINARAGHRGGDRVLLTAVDRLRDEMRAGAQIYRIGGDELAVLFDVENIDEAETVSKRARRALTFRSQLRPGDDQSVTASVGFAAWTEPMTPESFVESVETALALRKAERSRSFPTPKNVLL